MAEKISIIYIYMGINPLPKHPFQKLQVHSTSGLQSLHLIEDLHINKIGHWPNIQLQPNPINSETQLAWNFPWKSHIVSTSRYSPWVAGRNWNQCNTCFCKSNAHVVIEWLGGHLNINKEPLYKIGPPTALCTRFCRTKACCSCQGTHCFNCTSPTKIGTRNLSPCHWGPPTMFETLRVGPYVAVQHHLWSPL